MNINATLFGQMLTFLVFVWVTLRYIWPPIQDALKERRAKIAQGLRDANASKQRLTEAKQTVLAMERQAKQQQAEVIKAANHQAEKIIQAAKTQASAEAKRIVEAAKLDVSKAFEKARTDLLAQVGNMTLDCVEALLKREIDQRSHTQWLNQMLSDLTPTEEERA